MGLRMSITLAPGRVASRCLVVSSSPIGARFGAFTYVNSSHPVFEESMRRIMGQDEYRLEQIFTLAPSLVPRLAGKGAQRVLL
jgi:hypothetical protein